MISVCFALFCLLLVSPIILSAEAPDQPSKSDNCLRKAIPGSCKGISGRYYYDPLIEKCVEFTYTGCSDAVLFNTIEECQAACESDDSDQDYSEEGNAQASYVINAHEYAVYAALLKQDHNARDSELNKQTYKTEISPRTAGFLKEQGLLLDDSMIADFNEKNANRHDLAPAFAAGHKGMKFQGAGTDSVELSRVGFDLQRKKAVVFSRVTHIQQKAFYQENYFILLENSYGLWSIRKIVMSGQKYY
jgi:hypothetical protein